MLACLKRWARLVRRDIHALWFAARDARTPWHAKVLALAIAAYALSPIDLIPDFIPVLGYLDDAILLPLGILLAVRMVPRAVMAACRAMAEAATTRPVSRAGMAFIILAWAGAAVGSAWLLAGWWGA